MKQQLPSCTNYQVIEEQGEKSRENHINLIECTFHRLPLQAAGNALAILPF